MFSSLQETKHFNAGLLALNDPILDMLHENLLTPKVGLVKLT
jgi:hypothetical protein